MEWVIVGDVANVLQLSITLKLINAIVNTAKHARMHKRNCRQFAQHLKMIARLLDQLKPQDVEEYSSYQHTHEPLEHLALCLKKGLSLVENCRDKSYFYLIAMGWHIVARFKEIQTEIDRYLRLIPLITLVENHRERLKEIERDRREYTLDAEERKMLKTVLKENRTLDECTELSKCLSRSYPGFCLDGALQEEEKKLSAELQKKQMQMNLDECDVIEHLIEITKSVNAAKEEDKSKGGAPTHSRSSTMDSIESGMTAPPSRPASINLAPHGLPSSGSCRAHPLPSRCPSRSSSVGYPPPRPPLEHPARPARAGYPVPRFPGGYSAPNTPSVYVSPMPLGRRDAPMGIPYSATPSPRLTGGPVGAIVANSPFVPTLPNHEEEDFQNGDNGVRTQQSTGDSQDYRKWHHGLFDCCAEPFVCVSTFLYPCGTFASIAVVVTDGETTQEMACHDLAFHTLHLGCCCLTCCYRRKLRKRFNIPGGTCDDCWAHVLCCCCALVQEWREIEACEEEEGKEMHQMKAPPQLSMENYRARPDPGYQFQERYNSA